MYIVLYRENNTGMKNNSCVYLPLKYLSMVFRYHKSLQLSMNNYILFKHLDILQLVNRRGYYYDNV